MKDILNIIKEFEKLTYTGYVRKRPKNEPTDSYFFLVRQLAKCTMISDAINFHVDPVRKELISNFAHLWFVQDIIKRDPCGWKLIASMFYKP